MAILTDFQDTPANRRLLRRKLVVYQRQGKTVARIWRYPKLPPGTRPPIPVTYPCPAYLFGDASDGDATISAPVTLTRDMHYNNLTIAAGAAITFGPYRLFVAGTLDISAAPAGAFITTVYPGTNATSSSGGGVRVAQPSAGAPGITRSGQGGQGNTPTGTQAPVVTLSGNTTVGTLSAGNGGAGGAGASGAGGAQRAGLPGYPIFPVFGNFLVCYSNTGAGVSVMLPGASVGAPGGSGGGGDGTLGGGGGGGGGSAGVISIHAKTIARGINLTPAIFQAIGGAGGNGYTPTTGNLGGGGGGAGAAGGLVHLLYWQLTGDTIPAAVDVSSGAGGNGGAGSGTGTAGKGGGTGQGGRLILVNLKAGTMTVFTGAAATDQSANATGVAANTTQHDL